MRLSACNWITMASFQYTTNIFFITKIPYTSRKLARRNILSDKTLEQNQNIKFSSLTKEKTRVMIDVAWEGSTSI